MLTQLASLSAMAEQTAETFPDLEDLESESGSTDATSDATIEAPADATVVMPKQSAPERVEHSSSASDESEVEDLDAELDSNEPAAAGSAGSSR